MSKVVTVGVFDLLHLGHIRLFKRAGALGDHLTVAVQSSNFVRKYKPDSETMYSTKQRVEMVASIKYVDRAITYTTVDVLLQKIDYDILVVGPDQTNERFQKAIRQTKESGKKVVILGRTKDISSSELKAKIENIVW